MYDLYLLPPAPKDLDRLDASPFERVLKKIRAQSRDPRLPGSLKLTAEEGYRVRAGDYRILYRIDDVSRRVYIYRVKHRKDAYS